MKNTIRIFLIAIVLIGGVLFFFGVIGCSPVVRVYHRGCQCDTLRVFPPNMQWMPDTTTRNLWWADSTRPDSVKYRQPQRFVPCK